MRRNRCNTQRKAHGGLDRCPLDRQSSGSPMANALLLREPLVQVMFGIIWGSDLADPKATDHPIPLHGSLTHCNPSDSRHVALYLRTKTWLVTTKITNQPLARIRFLPLPVSVLGMPTKSIRTTGPNAEPMYKGGAEPMCISGGNLEMLAQSSNNWRTLKCIIKRRRSVFEGRWARLLHESIELSMACCFGGCSCCQTCYILGSPSMAPWLQEFPRINPGLSWALTATSPMSQPATERKGEKDVQTSRACGISLLGVTLPPNLLSLCS